MTELQEIKKAIQENNAKLELILSKIAPQSDLLTLQEVSKLLGKSKTHINKLALRINLIDPKAKGHKKYIRSEVEKLLSY
jgi:hypothetical protein